MRSGWKILWSLLKTILTVAILFTVGRQFARDLGNPILKDQEFRVGWLVMSAASYLAALGFSACFWFRLLHKLGEPLSWLKVVRAYYVSQLGKYLPGKAWALLFRVTLIQGHAVSSTAAALTTIYEVLTTMASGTILAAILFALLAEDRAFLIDWEGLHKWLILQDLDALKPDRGLLTLLALILLLPVGLPLLPGFFNRLACRVTLPFSNNRARPLPRLSLGTLGQGLVITSGSWLFFSAALWVVFLGVLKEPPAWSWQAYGRTVSYMCIAYVAGFVIPVPGGLGVREFLLAYFLVHDPGIMVASEREETRALAELVVIVLRIVWTMAEVFMATVSYRFPVTDLRSTTTNELSSRAGAPATE